MKLKRRWGENSELQEAQRERLLFRLLKNRLFGKNWRVVREAKGSRFRNIRDQFPIQRRRLRMTNGRKWKIEAALRRRGFLIFKSDYRFTEGIRRGWTEPWG